MNKNRKFYCPFVGVALFSMLFTACGEVAQNSGNDDTRELAVYFHYGFADGATLGADGKPSQYKSELKKLVQANGRLKALTTNEKKTFEVDGYINYYTESDEQLLSSTITQATDIFVRYRVPATYTVTFKNADGSTIKALNKVENSYLESSDIPNTSDPILAIDTDTYNSLDNTEKAKYAAYAPISGSYVLSTADLTSSIVTPLGSYFDSWTNITNVVTEDVTITASLKQTEAVVHKTSGIVIDGVKDDGKYVKVGKLKVNDPNPDTGLDNGTYTKKLGVGDWSMVDETKKTTDYPNGSPWADANIYASYDGEFIYVFVETFNQKAVCSLSKAYLEKSLNPYAGDCVDLWYGDGTNFHKAMVDAFGYNLYVPKENYSTYSGIMMDKANNMYANTLVGDDNLASYKTTGAPVKTNATGFNVEYKIPAYHDNASKMSIDKAVNITTADYGKKMELGEIFYVCLQLNNINALPTQSVLNQLDTLAAGTTDITSAGNKLVSNDETTQLGYYGAQMSSKAKSGNGYRITLG